MSCGPLAFPKVLLEEAEFVVVQLSDTPGQRGLQGAEAIHEVAFELVQVLAELE
jgi:hypothetical protein